MQRIGAVLLVLLLIAVVEHRAPDGSEIEATAAPAKAVADKPQQLLYGGDTQAWPIQTGNAADAMYCDASLKLPLARVPAWTIRYNAAEFSANPPQQVLHYDGTLVVSAGSTQIMLAAASDGTIYSKKDVYQRGSGVSSQEQFVGMYIAPAGRLVANDDFGRFYCFDLGRELKRSWTTEQLGNRGGTALAADEDIAVASWHGLFHALDLRSGHVSWSYPLSETDYGVTLSSSKVALWYSADNELRALDAATGTPLWTVEEPAQVVFAPIDDARAEVHALRADEVVECRDLRSGTLKWRYDWSGLLSAEQRRKLASPVKAPQLSLLQVGFCTGPDALYLLLLDGHVVSLDHAGNVRWTVKLDSTLEQGAAVLFNNGLLLAQDYRIPDPDAGSSMDAFNAARPGWVTQQALPDVAQHHDSRIRPKRRLYCQIDVLSLRDGAVLDKVVTGITPVCPFCPARDKIVFGGPRRDANLDLQAKQHVVAYNWLEQ